MPAPLIENPSYPGTLWNGANGVTLTINTFVEVARILPTKGQQKVVLTGDVTVADLTGLKLLRAATPDGTLVPVMTDSEFTDANTAHGTCDVFSVLPASPQTTANGSAFQLVINARACGALVIQAKSAGLAVVKVTAKVD